MSSGSQSQFMESTSTSKSPRRQLDFGVTDEDGGTSEDCENVHGLTVLKDINVVHSGLPVEMIPRVGYEFDTEEDALQYYLQYAKQVGFGVRKKTSYNVYHPWHVQPVYIPRNPPANIQQIAAMQQIPPQMCAPYMIDPSQLQAYWTAQSSQVHIGQNAYGNNIGRCTCQSPCAAGMFCRSSGHVL